VIPGLLETPAWQGSVVILVQQAILDSVVSRVLLVHLETLADLDQPDVWVILVSEVILEKLVILAIQDSRDLAANLVSQYGICSA